MECWDVDRSEDLYSGVVLFLLFGYGAKRKYLGPGEVRTCPRCGNTTQWTRMREFKQFTLFFVPVARWKRQQFEVCGICGSTVVA
jgi:zinc-ribbon family